MNALFLKAASISPKKQLPREVLYASLSAALVCALVFAVDTVTIGLFINFINFGIRYEKWELSISIEQGDSGPNERAPRICVFLYDYSLEIKGQVIR
jgi:hypothetical protein